MARRVLRSPSRLRPWGAALVVACMFSCADGSEHNPAATDDLAASEPQPVQPLDVPSAPPQSALSVFGGQTGSELTEDEAAGPCDELGTETTTDAGAGLGVSAIDVVEQFSGSWLLQVNDAESRVLVVTLSQLGTVRLLEQEREQQCRQVLRFSARMQLNVGDAGADTGVDVTLVAWSSDGFAALAEFEDDELFGARANDSEVLQLVFSHEAGVSSGWLQAAEDEARQKRRTLAVLLRR